MLNMFSYADANIPLTNYQIVSLQATQGTPVCPSNSPASTPYYLIGISTHYTQLQRMFILQRSITISLTGITEPIR